MILIIHKIHNSFLRLSVLRMIGFKTLNLLLRGIYRLVFTFLLQARVAFITNLKDCCYGGIHFLKVRWCYILTTLIFMISASFDECSSLSIISYDEMVTRNVTDCSVLHVESGSYIIKNGIIGPVIEHPTFTSSSLILNVSNRSSNIFLQSYINGFTGTELILNEIYGEQPATWNVNDILYTVNFFEYVSDLPGPFMQNI